LVTLADDGLIRIGQTRLDILDYEMRKCGEQVVQVWRLRQMGQHPFHRNPRALDDRLADHDPRILRDAVEIVV
jgi:hypothetical protein